MPPKLLCQNVGRIDNNLSKNWNNIVIYFCRFFFFFFASSHTLGILHMHMQNNRVHRMDSYEKAEEQRVKYKRKTLINKRYHFLLGPIWFWKWPEFVLGAPSSEMEMNEIRCRFCTGCTACLWQLSSQVECMNRFNLKLLYLFW